MGNILEVGKVFTLVLFLWARREIVKGIGLEEVDTILCLGYDWLSKMSSVIRVLIFLLLNICYPYFQILFFKFWNKELLLYKVDTCTDLFD